MSARITKEIILQRLKDKNIELLEDYIVGTDTVDKNKKCKCLTCNYGLDQSWLPKLSHLFDNHGCPDCGGNAPHTNNSIDNKLLVSDKQIKRIENCNGAHTKIIFECLKCNLQFLTTPYAALHNKYGHKKCNDLCRYQLTKEIIIERLNNRGIELLEEYIVGVDNAHSNKKCICKICNYGSNGEWAPIMSDKTRCPSCAENLPLTKEIVIERLKNSNIELLEDYITGSDNRHSNKYCRCMICNYGFDYIWSPRLGHIFDNHGCPNCGENAPLTNKIIDQRLIENHIPIKRLGDCINNNTAICCQCLKCDNIWYPIPSNILNKNNPRGCPKCNLRKNQKIMIDILQEFDNNFEPEYCLTKIVKEVRKLRFDIYSKKYNIALEYDGDGHFVPINFGTMSNKQADIEFEYTKARDRYKNNFCKEYNIMLIRIDGRIYKDDKLKELLINEIIPLIKSNQINFGITYYPNKDKSGITSASQGAPDGK
jgi:predicted  nucleic acid-binding Zn-ribbon protein